MHPQNFQPVRHRNSWDSDPSRPDAVGEKNWLFCVCFSKEMHPSLKEELQQWMEDNRVSMTEIRILQIDCLMLLLLFYSN